ncbi:NAD(FAD)-utilizing dehydrogenase [Alkalihalobacillus sp. R86527]|uniref:NAD(FAD)-utilizing dehydrogenase n=1 Tax=Alkalihalobacillus sp. R86527 TaxID=3093863 RepID=UPI00367301DD
MYDVIIIGAGVSAIFMAHKLTELHPGYKILMIDKGKQLHERSCKGDGCKCEACDQYIGFAGLGKSEGKFNYTNDFGGSLGMKVGSEKAMKLMEEVDELICMYGGNAVESYSTHNPHLADEAERHGLKVLTTTVRHLGTKRSTEVFQNIYAYLKSHIDFVFEADVKEISKDNGYWIKTSRGTFHSNKVVFSTGSSGSEWMLERCEALGLRPGPSRIDLGIRVEMRGDQLKHILRDTFETKLYVKGSTYEATTYCMNPNGRIIRKYQHGLVMADGQNQREKGLSNNLNFTLFVPWLFDSKNEADGFARQFIGGINQGRDRIVVQRFEDLLNQIATDDQKLTRNSIQPTLSAEPGNLKEEVPIKVVTAIQEFLQSLESLLGEAIDTDTLLYGMDGKFYEPKIKTDRWFETELAGLYLIGDCSGETHSLSQAAASGLHTAEHI